MNVIVFSRRYGRALQFELHRPRSLITVLGLLGLLLAGTFWTGLMLGRGDFLSPEEEASAWRRTLAQQRTELGAAKRDAQERLDALASRVGLMNAHVIRIDALGRRLTEIAGLDKGEFNFERQPAAGGPEAVLEGAVTIVPNLTAMLDQLVRQIQDREHQLAVLENMLSTRKLSKQLLPGGRPVEKGWISSYFGHRADPFTGRRAFHRGIDFAGPAGSNVVAVAAGVVTWSTDRSGYGRTVEVTHGNGYVTRYGHNERILVKVGDTVQKGQPIALIGSTGRSTGPHLHFEVLKNGQAVNPMTFVNRGAT
jgi:murein DD-endopeptidase MepM/ murein hydrolase activator NlpD